MHCTINDPWNIILRHHVILETSKKLPEHLAELDIYNKVPINCEPCTWTLCLHFQVLPLSNVVRHLEDAGEINVALAEHQLSKSETGSLSYQVQHDVCFVLDQLNTKKRKKAWNVFYTKLSYSNYYV